LSYGFAPTIETLIELKILQEDNFKQYGELSNRLEEIEERLNKEKSFSSRLLAKKVKEIRIEMGFKSFEGWLAQNLDENFSKKVALLLDWVPPIERRNKLIVRLLEDENITSSDFELVMSHFILPRGHLKKYQDQLLEEAEKIKKEIKNNLDYQYFLKNKIPSEKLKRPEELYSDEAILKDKITVGKRGWELAQAEGRVGDRLSQKIELLQIFFPDQSVTRDALLESLLSDQIALLELEDFKSILPLFSPFRQVHFGTLFLEELVNRHLLDPGFDYTAYDSVLLKNYLQKELPDISSLLELDLVEKVQVLGHLKQKWSQKEEVGPANRKSPSLPHLSFEMELSSVILPLFPRASHIRDELLAHLENFKSHLWEEVQQIHALLLDNQGPTRREEALMRNAFFQTLRDSIKVVRPEDKHHILFWLIIKNYPKPHVIRVIENGSGYSLNILKDHKNAASKADARAFIKEILEGDEGIFTSGAAEAEQQFLDNLFNFLMGTHPMSPEEALKYKVLYDALFLHAPIWKKSKLIVDLLEKYESIDSFEQVIGTILESYGLLGVKFAQILVSRGMISESEELLMAMRKLLDQANPLPVSQMYLTLSHLFSVPNPHVLYREIGRRLGSASIGQVHDATLMNGEEVIVKMRRPGLEVELKEDFEALKRMVDYFNRHDDLFDVKVPTDFIDLMVEHVYKELDYQQEVQNMERLRQNMQRRHREGKIRSKIPKVYPHLSNTGIITQEKVNGRKLGLIPEDWGLSPSLVRWGILEEITEQIFIDGFYHADPHEGNILINSEGEVYFIDAGQTFELGSENKRRFFQLFDIFNPMNDESENQKIKQLTDLLIEFVVTENGQAASLSLAKVESISREIMALKQDTGGDISTLLTKVLFILNKNQIHLPMEFYALVDTLGELSYLYKDDSTILMSWFQKIFILRGEQEFKVSELILTKMDEFKRNKGNNIEKLIQWGETIPEGTKFRESEEILYELSADVLLVDGSHITLRLDGMFYPETGSSLRKKEFEVQLPNGEWLELRELFYQWMREQRRSEKRKLTQGLRPTILKEFIEEGEEVVREIRGERLVFQAKGMSTIRKGGHLTLIREGKEKTFKLNDKVMQTTFVQLEGEWLPLSALVVGTSIGVVPDKPISSRKEEELHQEEMRYREVELERTEYEDLVPENQDFDIDDESTWFGDSRYRKNGRSYLKSSSSLRQISFSQPAEFSL